MRINFVDRDKDKKQRRRSGSSRRSRTRTYHSAIAQPQMQDRPSARTRRPSARQRQSRAQARAEQQEHRTSPSIWKIIGWRAIGIRVPGVLMLVALVTAIVFGSTDASFFVYDAKISGNQHIESSKIYEFAGVHEQHIFWIRPEEVAQRVAQIPGIKSVRVRTGLPGKVSIEVVERKPLMVWRTLTHGGDWWLDDEGIVLRYGGDADDPETIYVVDSSNRQLQYGDQIEPEEIVDWVEQLAAALPGARYFYYQGDRGLHFSQERLGLDWPVYVGNGENLTRKIQAVQALNEYLKSNNIQATFVDVRWPDLPVYGKPLVATNDESE